MQTRRTRFLPKALTVELRRLPWRLLGASLVGIAIACWLALISWSYGDPSPSYATLAQPHNWLGRRGASVADALMQSFGLASPFLVLPIAALGFRIAGGNLPLRPRLRAIYWAAAALAVPAFFAMFPTPARWLLDSSLGGIVGDFIATRGVAKLSAFIPPAILRPGFGLLFLAAGVWCVFRACGLSPKALSVALRGEPAKAVARSSKSKAAEEPQSATAPTLSTKVTSWVTRFSPREKALTVIGPARDYWLTRIEPRLTPAKVEPRRSDVASPKPVRSSAPSPFANWGSRPGPAVLAADEFATLTIPTDLGSLQASEEPEHEHEPEPETETLGDSGADVFEDIRIEPFFGPRRGGSNPASAEGAGGQEPETSSPLRRLTSNAIESARESARRILKNGAQAAKRRKPLIYVKNGGMPLEDVDEEDEETVAPTLPPISLLTPPPRVSQKPNAHDPTLMVRASALMGVLGDFGVKGRISGIYPGPVITLFELEPARGTKSSRVVGLADDIARSMSAVSARVAVVPGRDAIGIELPNPKREIVSFRGIIEFERLSGYASRAAARPRQVHRRGADCRRSGSDAASVDRGHHRLRQVGRDQHHDPVAALQAAAKPVQFHHDRSKNAGAVNV